MKTEEGKVYLVKFDDRHYKIGKSKVIPKRLKSFKGKKPIVIHSIWSNKPYKLETYFHELFDDKRILDELFELGSKEIETFKSTSKVIYKEPKELKSQDDYSNFECPTQDEYDKGLEEYRVERVTCVMAMKGKELRDSIPSLTEDEIIKVLEIIKEYIVILSYGNLV